RASAWLACAAERTHGRVARYQPRSGASPGDDGRSGAGGHACPAGAERSAHRWYLLSAGSAACSEKAFRPRDEVSIDAVVEVRLATSPCTIRHDGLGHELPQLPL